MNHDEKGVYCAPKSADHPASSIKKARELLLPLVLGSLKRNCAVTVVLWNARIQGAISFFPHDYIDKETNELWDTDALTADIISRTGISAFTAKGATNIEVALKCISENTIKLSKKCKSVTVWFLTDGEETFYIEGGGKSTRIPTNRQDPNFGYFHTEGANGLTKYQEKMIAMMHKLMEAMSETRCMTIFHWCHFGEAHPLFLRELRKATDGHFHAVADIAKLKEEVAAESLAATSKLGIHLPSGAQFSVSAATTAEAMYGRGIVERQIFEEAFECKKVFLRGSVEITLDHPHFYSMTDIMKDGISQILSLEPKLSTLITKISDNITPQTLNHVTKQLKDLRTKRNEAILLISKSVKSVPTIRLFLEKSLETIEDQIVSIERLIEGYLKPLGEKYDASSVKQNDYFSVREQMAISAGLESMKVRLGSGIANSSLDRRVQRLVASNGTWARSMLNRKCFISESISPSDADKILLSLFILEGREHRIRLQEMKKKIVVESTHEKLQNLLTETKEMRSEDATIEEKTEHKDGVLWSNLTVSLPLAAETITLSHSLPTFSLYPKRVCEYTVEVLADDLDGARDRFLDPLSYSNFLELISEENTLPAYLYTVRAEQTIGLIFNTLEMLSAESGGSDATSFSYFRLFWRLADQDPVTRCVQVPGTFSKANFALPMSPDPLTSLVFSSLMPGLMSEFVTGTPMAPLSGVGLMYIGFLSMHMRSQNISGVDVARMGDILSSLACWIDNPKTFPKKEDVLDIINRAVKEKAIASADAPGKTVPVKALGYFLMSSSVPLELRYQALHTETFCRLTKLLLNKNKGAVAGKNTPQQLLDNQLFSSDFVTKILQELTPKPAPNSVKSSESGLELETDRHGVPVNFMKTAEKMNSLLSFVEGQGEDEVVQFLSSDENLSILGANIKYLLHDVGSKALYQSSWWANTQRLFYVWFALGTYPIEELQAKYAAYQEPLEFREQVQDLLEVLPKSSFTETLVSWVEGKKFFSLEWKDGLFVRDYSTLELTPVNPADPAHKCLLLKFWTMAKDVLTVYKWKNRQSNAYGLFDIDYDVVKALIDVSGERAQRLSSTQQAEYRAAKEWRNKKYDRWAPPRPVIAELGDHTKAVQAAREISDKKRISIVILGNVDAGKSTTSGHIIADCGFIDPKIIEKFEREAAPVGKTSFKFAWVMDRLKNERELGKTIEVSTWNIETENFEVDILDAPGHKSFYKNMAVGASLADAATLIVSAAPGEFEAGIGVNGMTIEEALCAYTVGVRHFIIAVNKMDMCDYSEARFVEIVNNVKLLFKKNFIAIPENKIIALPMSAFLGENLTKPSDKFAWFRGWEYTKKDGSVARGKTLIEAIDAIEIPERPENEALRIPILRVHSVKGVGTVAVGRIAAGTLKTGTKVLIQPNAIPTDVTTIELHHVNRLSGTPGELIGFKVKGVKPEDLSRGMVAVAAKQPLVPSNHFLVQVIVINRPTVINPGFVSHCYCHTATFPAKWVAFRSKKDRRTGKTIEENPKEVKQGEVVIVEMVTDKFVCIEPFTVCPPLGRMALTTGKQVVAIGRIEEILPPIKQTGGSKKANGKYFK
eukprot:TRINITY_DN4037_c0_g1_i5.p1 TRINITY_DN4037_c0_g1~~TRINITY_DN4037_c0_g1_i5.p1  ORF type:complete len:1576 (-),score=392.54 TRINITY_DN4037_c0_g1_i5:89-4816(-)